MLRPLYPSNGWRERWRYDDAEEGLSGDVSCLSSVWYVEMWRVGCIWLPGWDGVVVVVVVRVLVGPAFSGTCACWFLVCVHVPASCMYVGLSVGMYVCL
jgi:hypothetical protein